MSGLGGGGGLVWGQGRCTDHTHTQPQVPGWSRRGMLSCGQTVVSVLLPGVPCELRSPDPDILPWSIPSSLLDLSAPIRTPPGTGGQDWMSPKRPPTGGSCQGMGTSAGDPVLLGAEGHPPEDERSARNAYPTLLTHAGVPP